MGKPKGTPQENHQKTIGKLRKTMGNSWENLRKTRGDHRKTIGKQYENNTKTPLIMAFDFLHQDTPQPKDIIEKQ